MLQSFLNYYRRWDNWLRCNRPVLWHLQAHLLVTLFVATLIPMSLAALFVPVRENNVPSLRIWLLTTLAVSLAASLHVLSRYPRPLMAEQTRAYAKEPLFILSIVGLVFLNIPSLVSTFIVQQRILRLKISPVEAILAEDILNAYFRLKMAQVELKSGGFSIAPSDLPESSPRTTHVELASLEHAGSMAQKKSKGGRHPIVFVFYTPEKEKNSLRLFARSYLRPGTMNTLSIYISQGPAEKKLALKYFSFCFLSDLLWLDLSIFKISSGISVDKPMRLSHLKVIDEAGEFERTKATETLFKRIGNLPIDIRRHENEKRKQQDIKFLLMKNEFQSELMPPNCFFESGNIVLDQALKAKLDELFGDSQDGELVTYDQMHRSNVIGNTSYGDLTVDGFYSQYERITEEYLAGFSERPLSADLFDFNPPDDLTSIDGLKKVLAVLNARHGSALEARRLTSNNLRNIADAHFNRSSKFFLLASGYPIFILIFLVSISALLTWTWRNSDNSRFAGAVISIFFMSLIAFGLDGWTIGASANGLAVAFAGLGLATVLYPLVFSSAGQTIKYTALFGVVGLIPAVGAACWMTEQYVAVAALELTDSAYDKPVLWGLLAFGILASHPLIWAYRQILLKPEP